MTVSGAAARPPLIELRDVTKIYGTGQAETRALRGVDLRIDAGEFVAVMGPSGSGKSTCMNILGCLDTPSTGTYRFMGADVGSMSLNQRAYLRRRFIGFVFQGYNLLKRTSAIDNVQLPLLYRGMPATGRRARALATLADVGLKDLADHASNEMSGGQLQRVAIARAIVTQPAVLLADEPTGNLDTKTSREIMDTIVKLNRDRGITVVMVTHDADMAAYARRLVHFVDGLVETDARNAEVA